MPSITINRGNVSGLRLAGYFSLFIGFLVALMILGTMHREYVAQRWPIASGEIIWAEPKSRTLSHSTVYWTEYTVRLNLTEEQCGPRDLWVNTATGAKECVGTFKTLEGSNADANGWIRRHAKYSHAQFHYEPHGSGVRFAGESVADIYPWTKIFAAFAICAVGFTLLQVAQRAEANLAEPGIQQTREGQSGSQGESELVDLKLR
jgi:hypothetical protein